MEPSDDGAPVALVDALRDFYVKSHLALDRLMRAHGASVIQARLLAYIAKQEAPRSVDIAEAFNYAPRTITEALDGLERTGLVRRVPSPTDRRAKIIALTPAGREALAASEPAGREFVETVFTALDPAERETLADLVRKLNQRLDRLAETTD